MAWEWSHTEDAYGYAYEQLHQLSRDVLEEIYQEWLDETRQTNTDRALMADDSLADAIWDFASGYEHGRKCDNGGHALWLCPHGCHVCTLKAMPEE